jgi:hypothetical protein
VIANKGYYYAVRAVRAGVAGGWSNNDLATTVAFTSIVAHSTPVSAAHLTQLQDAVNYARQAVGLGNATYTGGVTPSQTVLAQHIYDLRIALNAVCAQLNITTSYAYPNVTGQWIRAKDMTELQDILR